MKNRGIKVLSYFVADYEYDRDRDSFKNMYGNDASFIKPTNMMEVAKTMNAMFLQKWYVNGGIIKRINITLCVHVAGEWNQPQDTILTLIGYVFGRSVPGRHFQTVVGWNFGEPNERVGGKFFCEPYIYLLIWMKKTQH